MPFNKKLLTELRRAVGSQCKLAFALCNCVNKNHLGRNPTYCPQTINNWEKGHTNPNIRDLDSLYLVAEENGLDGSQFYLLPD